MRRAARYAPQLGHDAVRPAIGPGANGGDPIGSIELELPLVLASSSPRRRELLAQLVGSFEVVVSDVPEEVAPGEDPRSTAKRLARLKAEAVARLRPDALVLGADTVVAFKNGPGWRQLAKPVDAQDAVQMLKALSGRKHQVITGVCGIWPEGIWIDLDETEVWFRELSDEEVLAYAASGEPMDKAGAYAIQGGGAGFVSSMRGSTTNVIGLPTEKLSEFLAGLKGKGAAPARVPPV